MNVHNFGSSDPFEAEQAHIAGRQKLAELLLQQSVQGGPIYSNRAGIARMFTGALGGFEKGQAARAEKELGARREKTRDEQYRTLAGLLSPPSPTIPPGMPARDDEGNLMPGGLEETMQRRRASAGQLLSSREPMVAKAAFELLTAKPPQEEAYTLAEGAKRFQGGRMVAENPKALQAEKAPDSVRSLEEFIKRSDIDPQGEIAKGMFAAAARKATTHQPATSVNVDTAASKPFWNEFGKGQAEAFQKEQEQAKGASQMLQSIGTAKELLGKGIYSGTGADWRLSAGKALKEAGFNINQDDIANTEAFASTMGNQVLAGIKQLGAGSAISNADRDFMERVVGGKITLDPKGIERILGVSEQLARTRVGAFNKKAKAIQGQAPAGFMPFGLEVEEPAKRSVDDLLKLYGSGAR